MDTRWDLSALYSGFDSDEFEKDVSVLDEGIKEYEKFLSSLNDEGESVSKLKRYVEMRNDIGLLHSKLSDFSELSFSVNTNDQAAFSWMEKFEKKISDIEVLDARFAMWVSRIDDIEGLKNSDPVIKEHSFHLDEMISKARHSLDDACEKIVGKMKATGSSAWGSLHGVLTSSLLVEMENEGKLESIPVSSVRSMAYDSEQNKRKSAYEAELKAYRKIEKSIAASLNGIKGEVITVAELRGYDSPLDMTLLRSRMENSVLDAMLDAIKEYLPQFRKYYRKKASILGHKGGLPFYDLFAPVGKLDIRFSYEEARTFIVENFSSFSDELAQFADSAFEKRWIDAKPKEGKVGGAFCANLRSIKESRVLSNFSGSLNDVRTLAHELGHAYHGHCLNDVSFLNSKYPMPLAETASIFCETIINNAALSKADKDSAVSILETDISSAGQVIVDIYSRYLFESEVFKRRESGSLSVDELKDIMLKAQLDSYGDGLDENVLHPYMWLIKPHYYLADWNFYNFPYAFGLLFAKGLFAIYLERGDAFIDQYKRVLEATGRNSIINVAADVDIDVTDKKFWIQSLATIGRDIDKFNSF
jgi:pepF/M3 family oligoendopeptidase